jgi:hypothetical protein
MPSSLINDLSGNLGWPTSVDDGFVEFSEDRVRPAFGRGVTDSERNDITSLISDNKGRNDEPVLINVWNDDNGGYYNAMYYNKRYHVNAGTTAIEEEHNIIEHGTPRPRCITYSILCMWAKIALVGDAVAGCAAGLHACLRAIKTRKRPYCAVGAIAGCAGVDIQEPYACKMARRHCKPRT